MNQSSFRAALLDPALPVPDGLTDPAGNVAGRRFDVYRNNVIVSLTEALAQAFPVVRKLVGPEFFAAMAREHARAHPPRSPLMMFYGDEMPAFLRSFPPVAHLPYLPDVARLENEMRRSYHAADAQPVPEADLARLTDETLLLARFHLAPSVRLVISDWPIHSIWMANMHGAPPPRSMSAEAALVVRHGYDPEPLLLTTDASLFLSAILAGKTIGEAFDQAGSFDISATFALLIAHGAITGIATETFS